MTTEDVKTEAAVIVVEKSVCDEVLDHIYLACPVVCTFVLRRMIIISSVIAVGHLGAHYLAAAGLATVTANVTGNSMVIGLSGALTTLCSQAHGANNKKDMSIALQRALLIIGIFLCIPVSVLWASCEDLMIHLGQDAAIARSTKLYLVMMIPGLWALAATQCVNTWLYAQAKTKAVASIAFLTAVLHPLWLYILIHRCEIGFLGASIALSLTKWLELMALLVYMNCFSNIITESEFEWSWTAWNDWGPFLQLGLPSLLMISEWWASEIIIFISGALPNPEVEMGTMSIYQNLLALCFMLPAGVRESCATIVGNALGAGMPRIALRSSIISPILTVAACGVLSAIILPVRHQLGRIFTDDKEVVDLVSVLAPLIASYIITDGLQTTYTGVIKGVGKQRIAGFIVVFSYYVVAIPLSCYLALDLHGRGLSMGVYGLCLGTLVGTVVHALCFAVLVHCFTDMDREADLIKQRFGGKALTVHASIDASEHSGAHNPLNSTTEEDLSDESWWDELTFIGIEAKLPGRTAVTRNSYAGGLMGATLGVLHGGWAAVYRSVGGGEPSPRLQGSSGSVGNWARGKSGRSEYELVRAYTDSLSLQSNPLDEEDENYLDIDFDFI